jgi:hypothetical protein
MATLELADFIECRVLVSTPDLLHRVEPRNLYCYFQKAPGGYDI